MDENSARLLALIYMVLCLIVLFYIGFCEAILFFCKSVKIKIFPLIKFLTLFCTLTCILTTITDIIHLSFVYQLSIYIESPDFNVISVIADTFQFIGLTALYILIIVRLWVTFAKSAYQISRKFTAVLMVLILISFGSQIHYMVWVLYNDYIMQRYAILTVLFFDFSTNLSLLSLFIYKLHILVKNADEYSMDLPHIELNYNQNDKLYKTGGSPILLSEDSLTENIELGTTQQSLIKVITKQTVLTFIQVLAIHIYGVYTYFADSIYDEEQTEEPIFVILYPYRDTTLIIVLYALYLGFKANEKVYYCCCKCCDSCCYGCCIKLATNNIGRQRINTMTKYNPPSIYSL